MLREISNGKAGFTGPLPRLERNAGTNFRSKGLLSALVGASLLLCSCAEKETSPPSAPAIVKEKKVEAVTSAFLQRATSALETQLGSHSRVLEIRAESDVFSIQVVLLPKSFGTVSPKTKDKSKSKPQSKSKKDKDSDKKKELSPPLPPGASLVQFDYVETPGAAGQPPIGRVVGPRKVQQKGDGSLRENLYRFSEINLPAMARAFPIALLAVDPKDGVVERIVVRRYLPFTARIRGRIFVRSPRMSGSIDVNEKGTPLKR